MHTIINKQSQTSVEGCVYINDNHPLQLSINMDALLPHPRYEFTITGRCIPVGSVDFVDFLVLLKTLDFFSSIFPFQGLAMIAKHVASCLG
jgi:hypothetical protein